MPVSRAVIPATWMTCLVRLYDMTKSLMDRMNVEFEYQVRRSLGGWLLPGGAPPAPVQQQPLTPGPGLH